jgi:DNA polymerase III psi subunit
MEYTSPLILSEYQRAILNEMGISSWQLADTESTEVKVENQLLKTVAASSDVLSKQDALAKLEQLKVQTQKSEITDSVLVTLLSNDTKLQIFTDILIALGLDANQQKHISIDQLEHYSGYPLSWKQGEKISLTHKQLITPALVELQHFETKKQLWQQLQSAISLANN